MTTACKHEKCIKLRKVAAEIYEILCKYELSNEEGFAVLRAVLVRTCPVKVI